MQEFKVSRIVSLSDADINFQRQLGIHGQVKGFLPVNVRDTNTYDPARNRFVGYVGRIDFHAKGCERLIPIAHAMKAAGLPPLKVFTTAGKNSPHYNLLLQMIEDEGLTDQFDITLECTDKAVIYDEISILLLPSKKESFGNVILEANSFGIPVIAASYAPGPAELIDHEKTGFLLDDLSGEAVVDVMKRCDAQMLAQLSAAAFAKHKNYSMEAHFDFLETVATEAVNEFTGKNTLQVFPELKLVHTMNEKTIKLATELGKPLSSGAPPAPVRKPPAKAQSLNGTAKPAGPKVETAKQPIVKKPGTSLSRKQHIDSDESIAVLAAEIAELERRQKIRAQSR